MARKSASLFEQSLDRSVFIAYFLGAVAPLIGFAAVSERLSPMLAERTEQLTLAGIVLGTGVLSLAAFLALRRIVAGTITRLSAQNDRLEALLQVARELGQSAHGQQMVDETASACATRLADAECSWVLVREEADKPWDVPARRGPHAEAWLEAHLALWTEAAERRTGEDAIVRIEGSGDEPSVVMAPFSSERVRDGWLVVARRGRAFQPEEVDALSTLAALAGIARSNALRGDSQRNFFSHMTELVVAALDTHVQYRAGHANRVASSANRVGRALGLDDEALHDLHFGALLHDVGMLRIPAASQRDPRHFRKHPAFGFRMLSRIRVWQRAAPIVGQHHERLDGAGYPEGLVGEDICLGARILAVCDAWDAMRSDDAHRPSIPVDDALAELRSGAGTQFDPDVVSAFEALVRDGAI